MFWVGTFRRCRAAPLATDGQQIGGKPKCWSELKMRQDSGNLEAVRTALHGIAGVEPATPANEGPDRYLVVARMSAVKRAFL